MPRLTALAALLMVATSCRSGDVFTRMSDSTFVHVMVELRKLPVGATGNMTVRTQRRDSILRSFGVTAEDVESTAVELSRDPQRAADIWRAIESTIFTPP
jgi:hypothetical protein